VVGQSQLDPLYKDFPILIVKDWNKVDEKSLLREYERMKPQLQQDVPAMHRAYWWRKIEAARDEFVRSLGAPNASRFKCWG